MKLNTKHLLNIDDTRKLLDSVEQDIPLLDHGLVLGVLVVRPVGDHNASNLVYLSMQPSTGNEPAQLRVHELLRDTKGISHVGEGKAAIGLQQLSVGLDLHLPHVVRIVGVQVSVCLQNLFHLPQFLEEVCILTIIKRKQILLDILRLVKNLQDLTSLDHFLV